MADSTFPPMLSFPMLSAARMAPSVTFEAIESARILPPATIDAESAPAFVDAAASEVVMFIDVISPEPNTPRPVRTLPLSIPVPPVTAATVSNPIPPSIAIRPDCAPVPPVSEPLIFSVPNWWSRGGWRWMRR